LEKNPHGIRAGGPRNISIQRFISRGTGGSSSVRSSWDPMRKAGAAARDMLLASGGAKVGCGKSACARKTA